MVKKVTKDPLAQAGTELGLDNEDYPEGNSSDEEETVGRKAEARDEAVPNDV